MRSIRASAADTFMTCVGQPAMVEHLDLPNTDSVYAAEGTAAHELAAWCLINDTRPKDRAGDIIEVPKADGSGNWEFEVDAEMVKAVGDYVQYVRREAYGDTLLVERTFDVSSVLSIPGRKGTGDAIIVPSKPRNPLVIVDLKYGKGVEVEAEGNRQMRVYAGAFVLAYEDMLGPWDSIKMVIHQPRIGPPTEWTISRERLMKFVRSARRKSKEAQACTPGEKLKPGEKQCKFCPVKDTAAGCPAYNEVVRQLIEEDEQDLITGEFVMPEDLAALGERRKLVGLVQMWAKSVVDTTQEKLEQGQQVPGWKLVKGSAGNRTWQDEAAAAEVLKNRYRLRDNKMYTKKLISPTQVEKELTPQRYEKLVEEGLIYRPDGKPTVVPEKDPRDSLNETVASQFDDISGDD